MNPFRLPQVALCPGGATLLPASPEAANIRSSVGSSSSSSTALWPGAGVRRACMGCQLGSHPGAMGRGLPGLLPNRETRDGWSPECTAHNRLPLWGPRQRGGLGFSSESTGFKGRWRSAWISAHPSTAESYQSLEMSGSIPEEEEAGRLKKVHISQHTVGRAALPRWGFPPHSP